MALKVARFNLFLPDKGRLYVFGQNSNATVTVRKYEHDRLVEAKTLADQDARRLWRHLTTRIGYRRV